MLSILSKSSLDRTLVILFQPYNITPPCSGVLASKIVFDEVSIEIQCLVLVVLCWGGESRLDGVGKLKFELFVKLTWYYVDFGHLVFLYATLCSVII